MAALLAVDAPGRCVFLMRGTLGGGARSLRHFSRLLAVRREVR